MKSKREVPKAEKMELKFKPPAKMIYQCGEGHRMALSAPLTVQFDMDDVHLTSGPLCPQCFIDIHRKARIMGPA